MTSKPRPELAKRKKEKDEGTMAEETPGENTIQKPELASEGCSQRKSFILVCVWFELR
jgi:hypothetical protein